jgi:HSP20 family molecular chaperone IbpA
MDYMFGDFEKIINGLMRSTYEGGSSFQPRCDVSETKGHYLASFDMPGVKKEDIKIEAQYENGVLNIAIPKAETIKGKVIQIQSGQDSFFSKLLGSKKEPGNELEDVKVS